MATLTLGIKESVTINGTTFSFDTTGSADDVEIIFEKQNPDHDCEWCIYVKVRKNDKEQNVLMIRTNNKPYTRFTLNTGNMVTKSKDTLSEVMSNVVELSNFEKEIIDNAIEVTKNIKKDEKPN